MKELVWECGGEKVRWVLHGTPASGAGIVGALEMGASVICLCEDAHHKTGFEQALQQKCVEVMLAGSRVFKDLDLQARGAKLCPAAPGHKKAETTATFNRDDAGPKKQAKEPKEKKKQMSLKRKKKKAPAKKGKKPKKDDEDDEGEDETEDEDSEEDEEEDEVDDEE